MRDLVRANAQMFSVRTVSDSASTQDTSITADRARLRSVYLIDTSEAVAGVGLKGEIVARATAETPPSAPVVDHAAQQRCDLGIEPLLAFSEEKQAKPKNREKT